MRFISLGPLIFSLNVIFFLASILIFVILLRILEKDSEIRGFFLKRVLWAFFTGILFWKLTPVFTRFDTIFEEPALLLSINSGLAGYLGGLALGGTILFFTLLQIRKEKKINLDKEIIALAGGGCFFVLAILASLWIFPEQKLVLPETEIAQGTSLYMDSLAGGQKSLADYKGKVTVVNFWASWCAPCRAEIPEFSLAEQKLKDKVNFVGVNLVTTEKQGLEEVQSFVKKHKILWPQLMDSYGQIASVFKITQLPTTLVFNAQGKLIHRKEGAVNLGWLLAQNP